MSFFAGLRRRWRRHDDTLANRAYHDLYETEPEPVTVPIMPEPYGTAGPITAAEAQGEGLLADAIRNEDVLEHEEPTPEEAASNELATGDEPAA